MIKSKKKNGCLTLFIIGVVLMTILYMIGSIGGDSSTSNSASNNKLLAYDYAEDFVKKQLKSPSTANFPGVSEENKQTIDLGGGKYQINSWVDSQNGFGATIRTNFSCLIIIKGDTIRCEDLILK